MAKEITTKECIPYDDKWLKDILAKIEALEIPNPEMSNIQFCHVLSGDPVKGYSGIAVDLLGYYQRETESIIKKDSRLSPNDAGQLKLQSIEQAMSYALKFETEQVTIANKNAEMQLNVIIQQLKTYETIADLRMKLELFLIERDIAYAKLLSMKADYLLKRTQAISFVFNQRAKLVDILFNTVIVGVTQELMHVMNGPNNVMDGISPKQKFEEAWMDDTYLKDLNDLEWEGLCSPVPCECELCKAP